MLCLIYYLFCAISHFLIFTFNTFCRYIYDVVLVQSPDITTTTIGLEYLIIIRKLLMNIPEWKIGFVLRRSKNTNIILMFFAWKRYLQEKLIFYNWTVLVVLTSLLRHVSMHSEEFSYHGQLLPSDMPIENSNIEMRNNIQN